MQLTRKQIIQYLQEYHFATAGELSSSINVTQANIRHHLSILKDQNIVEEFGKILPKRRGRPTKMYRLAKDSLDNNLAILSNALINVFLESESNKDMPNQWDQVARNLLGEFALAHTLFQRLNNAIKWLNERHYNSRWEASLTGPRVILGYCPYWAVIESHPAICRLDNALTSLLIGLPVIQTEKLGRNPKGPHQCVFLAKA